MPRAYSRVPFNWQPILHIKIVEGFHILSQIHVAASQLSVHMTQMENTIHHKVLQSLSFFFLSSHTISNYLVPIEEFLTGHSLLCIDEELQRPGV